MRDLGIRVRVRVHHPNILRSPLFECIHPGGSGIGLELGFTSPFQDERIVVS
jgi:hypothetical protein